MGNTIIGLFLPALFLSWFLIPHINNWAVKRGEYDHPGGRKVHSSPIPRLGGVAIVLPLLVLIPLCADGNCQLRGLLSGLIIIASVGLADDLGGLSAKKKFFGQILAVSAALYESSLTVAHLGDLGSGDVLIHFSVGLPLCVFAMVGIINSINLIDGLDGLAGGMAAIAFAAFGFLGLQAGNNTVAVIAFCSLGSILGFLRYNLFPARIFMGDTGSLSIGFLLAFLAMSLTQSPGVSLSPIAPLALLSLPVFDTLWVMSSRMLQGRSPFSPDKTHLHHILLSYGLSHSQVVRVMLGYTLVQAVFVLVFFRHPASGGFLWSWLLSLLFGYFVLRSGLGWSALLAKQSVFR